MISTRLMVFLFVSALIGITMSFSILWSPAPQTQRASAAACSCNPPPESANGWTDNFCFHPPGTTDCPMTQPRGYCDPNGDGSYEDGDWVRGYYEYRDQCGSGNLSPTRPVPTVPGGGTPVPQPTNGNPQPTQSTGGTVDLNKCVGYDVYGLIERIRQTAGSELAEKVLNRFKEICGVTPGGNQPTPIVGAGTPSVSGSPPPAISGTVPSDLNGLVDMSEAPSQAIVAEVQKCLQNKDMYQQVAQVVGLPWQIFAGIHFREGGCDPTHSMVSGRVIGANEPDLHGACSSQDTGLGKPIPIAGGCGFATWVDSGIYGGRLLIKKIGRMPANVQDITLALSNYNGGGNQNCGKTPYSHCPPAYPREDDMYVNNKFSAKFTPMYLIYCADYTPCNPPKIYSGLGVLTAVKAVAW